MYCSLDVRKQCPFKLKPTETYLGEDANGYYVMDGFFDNFGNMFKRMVKFTPKSFRPSNIFQAVRNTALTTMTGGAYLVLPKSIKKKMENVANVALPVIAAGAAAYFVGPSILSMVGPKLSAAGSILGKNISSIGGSLFDALGKLAPSKQSEIAQQVTPEDIVYAEEHGGVYPPRVQNLISEAEKQSYAYAMMNSLQPNTIQTPATPAFYASSSLYPGLQQARMEQIQAQAYQQQDSPQQEEGLSPSATIGIALGGSALIMLLLRR